MILMTIAANLALSALADALENGVLEILDATRDAAFPGVLVTAQMPDLAVRGNQLLASTFAPATILATGEAKAARLLTAAGVHMADLTLGTEHADVLMDRTDCQRGGVCTISSLTLTLPLGG